jgi:cysteine-rich CPCC protein
MFEVVEKVELDDGRTLSVYYQDERAGWGCDIPGETKRPVSAPSSAEAIVEYLRYPPGRIPAWVHELSERRQRELDEAPRHSCPCCGYLTLLNPGRYDICAVCGWEDDPAVEWNGPDYHSGPNHISLSEGRANFTRFGASKENSKEFTRDPRPEERPTS